MCLKTLLGVNIDINYISFLYEIPEYGPTSESSTNKKHPLNNPLFLAKGPHGEIFVRDHLVRIDGNDEITERERLVVFDYDDRTHKFEYLREMCREGHGNGSFQDISGITASKEYLYVADSQLGYIQKLQLSDGGYIAPIGRPGTGDGEFDIPFGLELDETTSKLYICDYGNHRIQVFQNDEFYTSFGKEGSGNGEFNHPGDITMNNAKDQLFVADLDNERIQRFQTNGTFIGVFGDDYVKGIICYPFWICYTADMMLLISTAHNDCVHMVNATDERYKSKFPYSFVCPCGVITMNNGDTVVANMMGNKLTVI